MPLILPERTALAGTRGLTHWWPLTSGDTDTARSVPRYGKVYGTNVALAAAEGPLGSPHGNSMYYTGSTSIVQLSASPHVAFGGIYTVSFWMYLVSFTAYDSSVLGRIICWGTGSSPAHSDELTVMTGAAGNGSIEVRTVIAGATTIQQTTTTGLFTAGTWNHFVATCDGTTEKLYINGAAVTLSAGGNSPTTLDSWCLGCRASGVRTINGRLADVRFHSGITFGAEEVAAQYASYFVPSLDMPALNLAAGGGASIPFLNMDWRNPTQPPRLDQTWTWRQTDKFGLDRLPNRQQDWPLPTQPPREPGLTNWAWRQTDKFGLDRLPNRQQDWPLSSLHALPRNDQAWTWRQTDKFGKDTLPNRQQDWPVPPLHSLPRNDQSWGWRQTDKFGKDVLPFRQQDWPLPVQPWRLDQTWTTGFLSSRVSLTVTLPFNQFDWPNPVQAARLDQTWTWRQTGMAGQDRLPNRQQDWPLSVLYSLPRIDQTWAWRQTDKFGQDLLPFRQQDWQNPAAPPPAAFTWSWNQTGAFGQDKLPNRQQDWPNPVGPAPLDQAWTQGFSPLRTTVTVTFPFRQQDWPLPGQPPQIDQTWAWNQTGKLGKDVLPFRQQDWPNPALHTLPRIDATFIVGFTPPLLGSVINTPPPFTNYDWPNPLGHQALFQPPRDFAVPPGITLLPPPAVTILPPGGRGVVGRHFSRKRWEELKALIAAEEAAERKAKRSDRPAQQEALAEAAARAEAVIEKLEGVYAEAIFSADAGKLARTLDAAASAKRLTASINSARAAMRQADELMARIAEFEQDEEDAINMLLS